MQTKPQKQHKWLQKLVGNWKYEGEAEMAPGQSKVKWKGRESVRPVGKLWVVAEGEGEMPGAGMCTMQMTLGYDARKKGYVGTWFGSMMDMLWLYEGKLDRTGKVMTLSASGPSMVAEGKTAKYRDVITLVNKNHRTLTSFMQGKGGKWTKFMTAHYRRTK